MRPGLYYERLCSGKWPFRLVHPYCFEVPQPPDGRHLLFYDRDFLVAEVFPEGWCMLSKGYAIDGATVMWPISRVLNQEDTMHIWFQHDFGCQFDQLPAMKSWMPRIAWDQRMRRQMLAVYRRSVRALARPAYRAVRMYAALPKRKCPTLHATVLKP